MKEKIVSLFISDLHLGCKKNNNVRALEVLNKYSYENLFLLGDIIDIKALAEEWQWGKVDNQIWEKILAVSSTCKTVFTIGNHERCFFDEVGTIDNIKFVEHYRYKNMLLVHGHQFDQDCESNIWHKSLASIAYNGTSRFNLKICSQLKKLARRTPGYLKQFKERAFKYMTIFDDVDTIVLGHTHCQEHDVKDKLNYYNCGDFREDATYIIETTTGLKLKQVL